MDKFQNIVYFLSFSGPNWCYKSIQNIKMHLLFQKFLSLRFFRTLCLLQRNITQSSNQAFYFATSQFCGHTPPLTVQWEPSVPLGGESEQRTKGRRKRRALVGLGGAAVTRSAANRAGKKKTESARGRKRKEKEWMDASTEWGDVCVWKTERRK